jgi:phosphoribosyl 1,2-cyclic phosphodiesterase
VTVTRHLSPVTFFYKTAGINFIGDYNLERFIHPSIFYLRRMRLEICSLNSGSNANCYYVGNGKDAILVDAGLSCRETERRMNKQGLDMQRVKAIFISHEHIDHITGLPALSKKYRLPVYITPKTLMGANLPVETELARSFVTNEPVTINSLQVTGFLKSHDAADPHSFVVSDSKVNVGVFTDIGYADKELIRYFKQCHAVFLEANYCETMLENGSYPIYLKRRISGRKGHLSNTQALELFTLHRPKHLQRLVLSHLSKNNNDPALVHRLFSEQAGKVAVHVASRYEASPVFCIEPTRQAKNTALFSATNKQLSLF